MKKLTLALLVTIVLLAACGKSSVDHEGMNKSMQTHQMDNEAAAQHVDDIKATFKLSEEKPQPNQDTTIKIDLQDKQGKAIKKYDFNHEKQMHLIVVNKDLSFFNHIHPEYKGNGEFIVTTQLGQQY